MPKISIIVPVYNVEEYIHRCIKSILTQTISDFELILVDDGSMDNSGKICDLYSEKENRIKVIHKKNGGLSDARNAGLDIAQGDFIGFVDSDDYIEPDMYEKLLLACEANNSKMAMCGRYNAFDQIVQIVFSFEGHKIWESKEAIEHLLTWDNIDSSACDKLFSKDLFSEVRFPVGKYNEDVFIMIEIIHHSGKIVHIGEAKYYYFKRSNSITNEKFSEKKLDLLDANQRVIEFVKDKYPDLSIKADSFQLKGIIYLYELLQPKETKENFRNSYEMLKRLTSRSLIEIIKNPYIKNKLKTKALLMCMGIYPGVKSLKQKITRLSKATDKNIS